MNKTMQHAWWVSAAVFAIAVSAVLAAIIDIARAGGTP